MIDCMYCFSLIIFNVYTRYTFNCVVPQLPGFQGHPAHKQAIFYFGSLAEDKITVPTPVQKSNWSSDEVKTWYPGIFQFIQQYNIIVQEQPS